MDWLIIMKFTIFQTNSIKWVNSDLTHIYVYKHILNGIKNLSCEKRNWAKIDLLLIFKTNVKGKIIKKLCSFPKKCGIHFMELDLWRVIGMVLLPKILKFRIYDHVVFYGTRDSNMWFKCLEMRKLSWTTSPRLSQRDRSK